MINGYSLYVGYAIAMIEWLVGCLPVQKSSPPFFTGHPRPALSYALPSRQSS